MNRMINVLIILQYFSRLYEIITLFEKISMRTHEIPALNWSKTSAVNWR